MDFSDVELRENCSKIYTGVHDIMKHIKMNKRAFVVEFMMTLSYTLDRAEKMGIKITPAIMERGKGYINVDYGFLSLVLARLVLLNTDSPKEAKKVLDDLLLDEVNFTRNGFFVVAILQYFGLSFVIGGGKKGQKFYRRLILQGDDDTHCIISAVAINISGLRDVARDSLLTSKIESLVVFDDIKIKRINNPNIIAEEYKDVHGKALQFESFYSRDGLHKHVFSKKSTDWL